MADREQLVGLARIAEQAERYNEMVDSMSSVAKLGTELSVEERNLLSVAFKNAIGSRRASWRILSTFEQREESKQNEHKAKLARSYREQIEVELNDVCKNVIKLLDDHLIATSSSNESKIFYLKMKGDYFRYKAEILPPSEREEVANCSMNAYKDAWEIALKLPPTQPIRLGLALNFSVFYYEIMGKIDEACKMAEEAFNKAMDALDELSDQDSYKDSTLIMQLLRDNLTLWTSEKNKDDNNDDEGGEN